MVRVDIDVEGLNVYLRNKNRYKGEMRVQLVKALNEAGLVVQNEARRLVLKGPKTGRIYFRGKKGTIKHQASAPGEAPASDTGTLVRNILMDVDAVNLRATIVANTNYAGFLEFGTKKMRPRPYLSAALRNKTEQINKIFAARLRAR